MGKIKIGLFALLTILLAIQFFQPPGNHSMQVSTAGIATVIHVPDKVQAILQNSCYDCHSNNTRYPWYASLQPGAWWMASHINEGKQELNFDEFGNYTKRRQVSKLKAIEGSIKEESMPLPSYTFIHRGANLSENDQQLLKDWLEIAKDEISK